jgi:predicted metal-dependent hydrolase
MKMRTLNNQQIKNYVLRNPSYFEFMPQEIKGRLNSNEDLSVSEIQKKIIEEVYEPLTQTEIDKITPATQKAESELYDIIHKMGIVISSPMNWIIIKSKDGFNWDFCYTQGNVIILSQKSIDKDDNLARTLAHEMIHIYQRKHPKLFRNLYNKKMGFNDFKPNQKQIESIDELGIDKIYVDNPDNCRMGLMIYKDKYLPISVILPNEKKPVNIVLELTEDGVIWDKEKKHQMNAYDKTTLDQPNEMFAYMVTKNIK